MLKVELTWSINALPRNQTHDISDSISLCSAVLTAGMKESEHISGSLEHFIEIFLTVHFNLDINFGHTA